MARGRRHTLTIPGLGKHENRAKSCQAIPTRQIATQSTPSQGPFSYLQSTLCPCTFYSSDLLVEPQNIRRWSHWGDLKLVDLPMAFGVVLLDMDELSCLTKSRMVPIQVPQPSMEVWVPRANVTNVAFEVLDVDGVKADEGLSCVSIEQGLKQRMNAPDTSECLSQ